MATQATNVEVQGEVAPGFEAVRDTFLENFSLFPEVGASVAVMIDGELVVDLWAGRATDERAWERDTLVNVWSSTKGATALAAHMLADRGLLDFEAPVAQYWPEFAAAGKASVPVRYLLTHQAGLSAMPEGTNNASMFDWDHMVQTLAVSAPQWEPGSQHQYHALTFGWLVGEVVRRVSGKTPGEFIRDEIAGPLGIDFEVGLPASEDGRVASILHDPSRDPVIPEVDWNSRACRVSQIPAANGHANARSLATMYGALGLGGELNGVRLLSPEAVERAGVLQVDGLESSGFHMYRTLGFMRRFAQNGDVRPASTWGHAGAGGSQGFVDPDRRLGFGYAMSQMLLAKPEEHRPSSGGMDPRGQRLVRLLYAALEARG
ncbi:MAG: serine hydrolase domain-containing protein [Dehalococcoidia bacterium]